MIKLKESKEIQDNLKTFDCKFRHNQKVIITKGYFKSYKGLIKAILPIKDTFFYDVEIEIDERKTILKIPQIDLKLALW